MEGENLLKVMPEHVIQQFDVIVTGDDVSKGKPHPEPYLKAAAKLGVNPSECIVVENAQIGVQSAKAAQMLCVGVTSTQTTQQLQKADKIVPDLNRILEQLESILY